MLRKGCQGHSALVRNTTAGKTSILDVLVACEFPDVFPDELPGLPPHKEIEFCIEVVLDITLILILPYEMTPAELKELLDKNFIRPSTSP